MAKTPKKPAGAYEVGYGRPPRAHQFKPGQSGNPRGRPKGQPSLSEVVLREAARLVSVKTPDGVIRIPKREAIVRKLINRALEGDFAALRLLLPFLSPAEPYGDEAQAGESDEVALTDAETIARMLDRLGYRLEET
jgi:hypothetical protein